MCDFMTSINCLENTISLGYKDLAHVAHFIKITNNHRCEYHQQSQHSQRRAHGGAYKIFQNIHFHLTLNFYLWQQTLSAVCLDVTVFVHFQDSDCQVGTITARLQAVFRGPCAM